MQVDVTLMDQNMVSAAFTRFHKILKVGQAFYFVRCKAHWTMIWKKKEHEKPSPKRSDSV